MIAIYFSSTGNTKHCVKRFGERCTLCYRCVNKCRQKAITILGKAKNLEKSVAAELKDI